MERQDEIPSDFITNNINVRKQKLPTQLNITINIPLRGQSKNFVAERFVDSLEEKVSNIRRNRKKRKKKKHRHLKMENIKMPIPIKEEVEDNSSLLDARNEMCHLDNFCISNIDHVLKESPSAHNTPRGHPEDLETYSCFINGLTSPARNTEESSERGNTPFSLNTFLNRIDEKVQDHLNTKNKHITKHKSSSDEQQSKKKANCNNINISKEEISDTNLNINSIAKYKAVSQDLFGAISQTNLNSADKIGHEDTSLSITNNHYKSMSVIYDIDNNIQDITPKKRKRKTHSNEITDLDHNCDEEKKTKKRRILNSEENLKEDAEIQKHKSKKKKVELCNKEVNNFTTEDSLLTEKEPASKKTDREISSKTSIKTNDTVKDNNTSDETSSESKPQDMVNHDKNIFKLKEKGRMKDSFSNKKKLFKSKTQNDKKSKQDTSVLMDSNAVEKSKSNEKTLSKTKEQIGSQLKGKNEVDESTKLQNKVINDVSSSQSAQENEIKSFRNKESNQLQFNTTSRTDSKENNISENINEKASDKSKKKKVEMCNKEVNNFTTEDSLSTEKGPFSKKNNRETSLQSSIKTNNTVKDNTNDKASSESKPQDMVNHDKNIFNLKEKGSINGSLLNKNNSFKSKTENKKKEKQDTINLRDSNAAKKFKSNEKTLSKTKEQIGSQLRGKNNVDEPTKLKDKVINDVSLLQSTQENKTESNQLQLNAVSRTDLKENTISENVNEKCALKAPDNVKGQCTKKTSKIKEKSHNEDVNKIGKAVNRKKKTKNVKTKSNLLKNYESSEDEENNFDSVMDFVKNFVKKTPNFKMHESKLKEINDNNYSTKEGIKKSSTVSKSLASDSTDGFSSDDLLSDFSKQFNEDGSHKQKDSNQKAQRKTKQDNLMNYISVTKKKQKNEECDKIKRNTTLIQVKNTTSRNHNQGLTKDLNTSASKEEKSNSNVCVIEINTPDEGKRYISDTQRKIIIETSSKSFELRSNKTDQNNAQLSQSKLMISSDNRTAGHSEDELVRSKNQGQDHNNFSKTSHSTLDEDKSRDLENGKRPAEKVTKEENSKSKKSMLADSSDDKPEKSMEINKFIRKYQLHHEINLDNVKKSNETIEQEMSANVENSSTKADNDESEKKKEMYSENVKKSAEKTTKLKSRKSEKDISREDTDDGAEKDRTNKQKQTHLVNFEQQERVSSSEDIDDETERNIPISTNKLSEKDKLHKRMKKSVRKRADTEESSSDEDSDDESGREVSTKKLLKKRQSRKGLTPKKVKKPVKRKIKEIIYTSDEDTDDETEKKYKNKELMLNYFDKIMKERYNSTTRKCKSPAIVNNSGGSSDNSMCGVSDFKTDKESDDEETKLKMMEIISRAEEDLLNIMEENEDLKDLDIYPDWDVPISHTIETRISSCPTPEQRLLYEEFHLKMKVGPFTKLEDDTIKKNFKTFCKVHGIKYNAVPFLNFKYGNVDILSKTQRINFARYLGRGLESRMLFCIYNRFKNIYSSYHKGRFKPEEDAVIMHYMKTINDPYKQFSSLSKILKRPRLAIEKRHKTLMRKPDKLTAAYYPKFVHCLMEVTHVEDVKELKDRTITNEEWNSTSKILSINVDKLKLCWTASLYTKLFNKGPIRVDKIMRKLIQSLDETEEDDYRDLNWLELAQPFKNMTRGFLYRIFKRTRDTVVPSKMHSDLRKCVLYLKEQYAKKDQVMADIPNITLDL